MNRLLPELCQWFLAKEEQFRAFAAADTRIEGWFKAELIVLFNQLKQSGQLKGFEREANILSPQSGKRNQIDFRLELDREVLLCELKALCISRAAGTNRNLQFYFRDNTHGSINDFRKLNDLPAPNKWVLAFIYPTPEIKLWHKTIGRLPTSVTSMATCYSATGFPRICISLFVEKCRRTKFFAVQ